MLVKTFFVRNYNHNEGDRRHAAEKFGLTPNDGDDNRLETMDGRVGTDGTAVTGGYHKEPLDTTPSEN
ncbi:MAG TPA: hypothetical protein PKU78_05525 [Candidatus Dojkabacteria bacterium]|nr:hypothetical protein [Candidatus Dojkabacteria bacterium]HRO65656.1 hypothetical protein [Candidatus Dojkabacteria bacterium]HRP37092.1 hypothetical protein [Candidatus Dojkabacteria bacterium]HRP51481.1 hypothetical protein [Candidatus Dojkabacteria bacterium]